MNKILWIEDVCNLPGMKPNHRREVVKLADALYEALDFVEILKDEQKSFKEQAKKSNDSVSELVHQAVDLLAEEFLEQPEPPKADPDPEPHFVNLKKKKKKNG